MTDFVKTLIDGADKIADILNIGRLLFYTAAGYCAVLPVAMCLLLLSHDSLASMYWTQFQSDMTASAVRWVVWLAGLVFGFIIASLTDAIYAFVPGDGQINEQLYAYQYPRLFSGGIKSKDGTNKDYAAWLISEYYRFYEIILFVPFGLLLSLPVYSLYTLIFVLRASSASKGLFIGGEYLALPIWVFGTTLIWTQFWPDYWLPKVVQPAFSGWIWAKRNLTEGLEKFVADTSHPDTAKPAESKG